MTSQSPRNQRCDLFGTQSVLTKQIKSRRVSSLLSLPLLALRTFEKGGDLTSLTTNTQAGVSNLHPPALTKPGWKNPSAVRVDATMMGDEQARAKPVHSKISQR